MISGGSIDRWVDATASPRRTMIYSKNWLLVFIALGSIGCATYRQVRDPATIPPDGRATQTRVEGGLDYSVAIHIDAPPATVWSVLTDARSYTSWNSSVVKLDGEIAADKEIELVSKDAPDRTFKLKVSAFEAPR